MKVIKQIIVIPNIILEWSDWYSWNDLLLDCRSNKSAPKVPSESGVYEVKEVINNIVLTIGKGSNLRSRIKQGLVKGKLPHSTGKIIRSNENVNKIKIRWAITERPSAVEEELHIQYKSKNNRLPKYTKHT